MFSRVARRYDLLNFVLGGGTDRYWRWYLVRAVAKQNPARILDLATGSGDVLLALQKRKAFTELAIGADFCAPMLQVARTKGLDRLMVADALNLPFADASLDAITIAFGLRNLVDRLAGLKEMRRVLRPGGKLYVLEFTHPIPGFAQVYFAYLNYILPYFASLFTSERSAYQYLSSSIQAFPKQPQLVEMMVQANFSSAKYTNLTLGIVALHEADV